VQVWFGDYALDTDRRELTRADQRVSIGPQVFDLLVYLVQNRERVVSKADLFESVWCGRIVSESTLTSHINAVRKAIGDSGEEQHLIRTIARKGFRFVGEIRKDGSANSTLPAKPMDTESALLTRTIAEATGSPPALTFADKPSIAVLPFTNMSGDVEQEYFADGMVEEIITGLSRIKWLLVISRNSSFTYKNKSVAVKEVADKLGARYVLEGGVRKSGNRVRITAQLIDAGTGVHLWAKQYDRLLEDVFVLQDEITMRVIGAIEPNLRKAEIDRVKRQRPSNLNAYDLLLRALPFVPAEMPKEAAIAIPLLEDALKLEPNYGAAHAFLSWCLHIRFARGGLRQEDRIAAIQHAHAATAHGNDDATSLAVAAFVVALDERNTVLAFKLFDRALEFSNSNVFALSLSAIILAWMGKNELAIERAQRALQLSPFDSFNSRSNHALAIAYFYTKRYEDAVDAARSAIDANPSFSIAHAVLAAALIQLGRVEEAKAAAEAVLRYQPFFTIREFSQIVEFEPAVFRPIADAWRAVGLPE
jgi:TolB-like protein